MPPLTTYLVGIMYHEPEPFALWNRGVIEDYESSTGIFIDAPSREAAIAWGEVIGQAALRKLNCDESLDWKAFGYSAWIEESIEKSRWSHAVSFFQHVKIGEMPELCKFSADAYKEWAGKKMGT
jgi:hypothetical protein